MLLNRLPETAESEIAWASSRYDVKEILIRISRSAEYRRKDPIVQKALIEHALNMLAKSRPDLA